MTNHSYYFGTFLSQLNPKNPFLEVVAERAFLNRYQFMIGNSASLKQSVAFLADSRLHVRFELFDFFSIGYLPDFPLLKTVGSAPLCFKDGKIKQTYNLKTVGSAPDCFKERKENLIKVFF